MEYPRFEKMSFFYPGQTAAALSELSFSVTEGEFVTLIGDSGSGKSTLLRLCHPSLAPHGRREGGLSGLPSEREVGMVMQDPDAQIVTDRVSHELAFGLESCGLDNETMHARVAEITQFFGIGPWFHKSTSELSGGQKQLLNLASVMVMQPGFLLLDEPTAQLDQVAAEQFLQMLRKINTELGTTILISEHRTETVLPMSDRVAVLERGRMIADGPPREMGALCGHSAFFFLPTPLRAARFVGEEGALPLTVREGREWLADRPLRSLPPVAPAGDQTVLTAKGLFFRYGKDAENVLNGASLSLLRGETFALLGGNGSGKSTALSVLAGLRKPDRGTVCAKGMCALLPQDPVQLFCGKTVREELEEMGAQWREFADRFGLLALLQRHCLDLSGGERQRLGLAKVLMTDAPVYFLDEPTKGMDPTAKAELMRVIAEEKERGKTFLIVSHDVEFCAMAADRCGLFFDGRVDSVAPTREFFAGKRFYTTAANRMTRGIAQDVICLRDLIFALNGKEEAMMLPEKKPLYPAKKGEQPPVKEKKKRPPLLAAILFAVLFVGLWMVQLIGKSQSVWLSVGMFAALAGAILCFCGFRRILPETGSVKPRVSPVVSIVFLLIAIATAVIGMAVLKDRKYYFISLMILLEGFAYLALTLERRTVRAREAVLPALLCAFAIAGRSMFFALPQFKPMLAIVILTGVAYGGGMGFAVGAVSVFVSNFYFGQGAWTPWQMISAGLVGFLAGVLFSRKPTRAKRISLALFGLVTAFVPYGLIVNTASLYLWQPDPTVGMWITSLIEGAPFDLIHAAGTAFFLFLLSVPILEKTQRVRQKYGL